MKNTMIKDTLILTVITLLSGLLLGAVYVITKEPIKEQEETARTKAYKEVFEAADEFKVVTVDDTLAKELEANNFATVTVNEIMRALDKDGNLKGYALSLTTSEGYGGDITFTMGVALDGTINGISILNINETAGLGMNAKKDEFKGQYSGKQAESLTVIKSGSASASEINAISGATRTSRAITNGVNAGLCAFRYVKECE